MKERTEELLVAQIFGLCFKQARTVDEVTKRIYKNEYAKNVVRVFQCCEILMKNGILVPKFQDRQLRFQINMELLMK